MSETQAVRLARWKAEIFNESLSPEEGSALLAWAEDRAEGAEEACQDAEAELRYAEDSLTNVSDNLEKEKERAATATSLIDDMVELIRALPKEHRKKFAAVLERDKDLERE